MISREDYLMIRQMADFSYFPIDSFDRLMASTHLRKVPKDHIIFFEGDKRDKLFLIKSGYVKIEEVDASGSFLYTDYVKHQTIFPYGGMFIDEKYHFSAIAMTDVEYFYFPTKLYETYLTHNNRQLKHLTEKLSCLLRIHEIRLRNMVTSSASERVVQALAILLFDICEDDVLPFAITSVDIAKMSGTTRETVSHVLKDLKKAGVLDFKHKILTYLKKDFFLKYME